MKRTRHLFTLTAAGAGSLLLSSCFIVKVPLSVTGAVLEGTAKVGSKAASATVDAFSKSDEEKEADEKKKAAKEAEKNKQQQPATQQPGQPGQPGQTPPQKTPKKSGWDQPSADSLMQSNPTPPPPSTDNDGFYKPSITPDMIKKGQTEQPVTPSPVPKGY